MKVDLQMLNILIVGCGYVGREFTKLWSGSNQGLVHAVTRSHESGQELEALGIVPHVGNWLERETLNSLPSADYVLVSVPHRAAPEFAEQTHAVGLQNLVSSLKPGCRKIVYLSTTGVYGDAHNVVDENTPVSPAREGPQVAVTGENWLQNSSVAFTIIRLAGIYGPNRIPLLDKLRSRQPLPVPREGWLNLCHVADIARMLMEVTTGDMQQNVYVFSDGQPVERETFYRFLAQRCGVAEPEFVAADPSASRTKRAGNKRVDPSTLVREIGFRYLFPDYERGLDSILEADSGNT